MGDHLPAVELGTDMTATSVSAGYTHTCVVLGTMQIKCWGLNDDGQLGLGHTFAMGDDAGEMGDNLATVELGSGRTAVAVSAGGVTFKGDDGDVSPMNFFDCLCRRGTRATRARCSTTAS